MTQTTDDGTLLLAAILANPDEDTPRLVYADWLQEQGHGERAEFIRVQCELAGISYTTTTGRLAVSYATARNTVGGYDARTDRWNELCRRERELFHVHGIDWSAELRCGTGCNGRALPQAFLDWWSRGFLNHVECSAADWLKFADAILAAHPVRRVLLTTWPGEPYFQNDGSRSWSVPKGWCRRMYTTGVIVEICDRKAEIELGCRERWPRIKFTLPSGQPE